MALHISEIGIKFLISKPLEFNTNCLFWTAWRHRSLINNIQQLASLLFGTPNPFETRTTIASTNLFFCAHSTVSSPARLLVA